MSETFCGRKLPIDLSESHPNQPYSPPGRETVFANCGAVRAPARAPEGAGVVGRDEAVPGK